MVVVMFVVAVLSAVLVARYRVQDVGDVLENEIRRFEILGRTAWEQAMVEGRSVGIEVTEDAYTFYLYDPLQLRWITLEGDRLFKPRELPETLRFELLLDEVTVQLQTEDPDDEEQDEDDEPAIQPQILYLSSGEVTPYTIIARSDASDVEVQLRVDLLGRSVVEIDDPQLR